MAIGSLGRSFDPPFNGRVHLRYPVNFANGERGEEAGFFLEIERDVWMGRWVGTRSRDCGNFDRLRL